jgi:hypothetical protein
VWQWSNSLAKPAHWEAGQLPCPGQAQATQKSTISYLPVLKKLDQFPFVSMWIRIQFFTSMRIRIQGAKRMRILADPDPGQTLPSQKDGFLHEKYTLVQVICHETYGTYVGTVQILKTGNEVYLLILVKFLSPGSGSTFPILTQESQIKTNPCGYGPGSETLV